MPTEWIMVIGGLGVLVVGGLVGGWITSLRNKINKQPPKA